MEGEESVTHFQIKAVRGFSYLIPNGTIITEYPGLGVIMILKNSLRFFDGENMEEIFKGQNQISTISLRGHMLAIGEKMFKGQLTTTTILNLQNRNIRSFQYQKSKMQSLSISKNHDFLSSLGSSDTGKQEFLIIDLTADYQIGFKEIARQIYLQKQKNRMIMAHFSENQNNLIGLLFANRFVLGYVENDRLLQKSAKANKVRQFSSVIFDPYHQFVYLSSKNGDISEIDIETVKETRIGPRKRVIISGIKHIRFVEPNKILITGVKGFIGLVETKQLKILKEVSVESEIISMTDFINDLGFITTNTGDIYVLNAETLDIHAFYTTHNSKITDISFANGSSQLFGSAAGSQIIIWKSQNLSPLLKIKLKNKQCLCLEIPRDGKSIISGWNDDCIRFFNPVTGKQVNKINKANNSEVTALIMTLHLDKLISGGKNGSIRVWSLEKDRFGIIDHLFTGHKGLIHSFFLEDELLYSSSEDGSYGIWDLQKGEKRAIVQLSNFVTQTLPISPFQIMFIGSGSKISICRKDTGELKKEIKLAGSHFNAFQKLTEESCSFYIFGGEEPKLFIKKYFNENLSEQNSFSEEYETYGEVIQLKVSPDNESIVVGTTDGTILLFKYFSEGTARQVQKKATQKLINAMRFRSTSSPRSR